MATTMNQGFRTNNIAADIHKYKERKHKVKLPLPLDVPPKTFPSQFPLSFFTFSLVVVFSM